MNNILNNLYSILGYGKNKEITETPEKELHTIRANEIKEKITSIVAYIQENRDLIGKVNIYRLNFVTLEVKNQIYSEPRVIGEKISIPYLFLLKTEDIPEKFLITKSKDPRLQSDEFLQEFANWSQEYLQIPKIPLTIEGKTALRVFLPYISNSKLSEQSKEFVLAHELSHILHQHISSYKALLTKRKMVFMSLAGIASSICVGLSVPIEYVISFSAMVMTVGISWSIIQYMQLSHSHEKEADLTAAKIVPESIDGAIYLFRNFCKYGKKAREESFLNRLLFSSEGNWRIFYASHPSESQRIGYLKDVRH